MKRFISITLLGVALAAVAQAQTPELRLSLAQAEQQAREHSHTLKAKQLEWKALEAKSWSYAGQLWPRLSLEASWKYIDEIPSIALPVPGASAIAMGDHTNYSVGPMLTWNIWTSGGTYHAWQSVAAALDAKTEEVKALEQELTLQVRLAYFQTQLALEQVQLSNNSLAVARAQYRDIQAKNREGAASRLDLLSSHLEVLLRERLLLQSRTQLSANLRDLQKLLGSGQEYDLSFPLDPATAKKLPRGSAPPTVFLYFDLPEESLQRLEPAAQAQLDAQHPRQQVFKALAESAQRAASAANAGHWPRLQLYAKTSLDYPNGPVLEQINQNVAGVQATWSLWEGRRVVQQVEEHTQTAAAHAEKAQQAARELSVSWEKAQDLLAQLRAEQKLNTQQAKETQELANLMYQAYRLGRARYLEVQDANLRALQASNQYAVTRVQILIQLARLDSLAQREEK